MKTIKDPVHGYVEVEDWVLPLLDSSMLQRLRYVKQLGFSYLVYPGANHTRFEHSLGTMHLAGLMCRQIGLEEPERRLILVAALIHDIGHGPLSHAIEPLMREYLGHSHHEIADLFTGNELLDLLSETGIDWKEVCAVILGTHPLSGILQGDLDVDRMDYLLRDAHYTGVPYGTVDVHRLVRSTLLTEGGIVLDESGANAAESLLIARTLMRPAVYFHHVSRIAETMFNSAVRAHVGGDASLIRPLLRMDDAACIHTLLASGDPAARMLTSRVYQRRLFKRAIYVGRDQVNSAMLREYASSEKRQKIAAEIADAAGVEEWGVLIDIPPLPVEMSIRVQVRNRHALIGLDKISPIVTTLNETRLGQWRLGVYTAPEDTVRVADAASEVFHVRPFTRQDTLPLA